MHACSRSSSIFLSIYLSLFLFLSLFHTHARKNIFQLSLLTIYRADFGCHNITTIRFCWMRMLLLLLYCTRKSYFSESIAVDEIPQLLYVSIVYFIRHFIKVCSSTTAIFRFYSIRCFENFISWLPLFDNSTSIYPILVCLCIVYHTL